MITFRTLNINIRCIEIMNISDFIGDTVWLNINIRCIEIRTLQFAQNIQLKVEY